MTHRLHRDVWGELLDHLRRIRRLEAQPSRTRARFHIKVFSDVSTLSTGDGKFIFAIPSELNGWNLVDAQAYVTTVSSSGLPTVQLRNVTDSVDMLSTRITIDASEYTSYTAATPRVINTTYDDVATGDRIAIDVDVAGTGAKGLGVIVIFGRA